MRRQRMQVNYQWNPKCEERREAGAWLPRRSPRRSNADSPQPVAQLTLALVLFVWNVMLEYS